MSLFLGWCARYHWRSPSSSFIEGCVCGQRVRRSSLLPKSTLVIWGGRHCLRCWRLCSLLVVIGGDHRPRPWKMFLIRCLYFKREKQKTLCPLALRYCWWVTKIVRAAVPPCTWTLTSEFQILILICSGWILIVLPTTTTAQSLFTFLALNGPPGLWCLFALFA